MQPPGEVGFAQQNSEGVSAHAADLLILQNDRMTIPHPLRGSSLYTREPFLFKISRQLPLLGEPFYLKRRRTSPLSRGPFVFKVPQNFPFAEGGFLVYTLRLPLY